MDICVLYTISNIITYDSMINDMKNKFRYIFNLQNKCYNYKMILNRKSYIFRKNIIQYFMKLYKNI